MPYTDIPQDPIILLSFVNTQLRDHYSSLGEFCVAYDTDQEQLIQKLGQINYLYDEAQNRFI